MVVRSVGKEMRSRGQIQSMERSSREERTVIQNSHVLNLRHFDARNELPRLLPLRVKIERALATARP